MMDRKKFRELFLYLVFGILTTVVGLAVYYACVFTFLNPENALQLQAANVISWIFAVAFAYVTNRIFVFNSKNENVLFEALKFFSARLFSLGIDMLIMFVFVSCLGLNDKIIKIVSQFVVIVLNYVLSKIFVFKNKKNAPVYQEETAS